MSRTGIEEKPAWRVVPREVREGVASSLGAPVVRASRVWGGYAPTPTFRLLLADGRRAFLKAVNGDSNPFMVRAFEKELRFYQELRPLVAAWCAELQGSFVAGDWQVMLLEDLGPKAAPPWNNALALRMMPQLAAFHLATRGGNLPGWLEQQRVFISAEAGWEWLDDATMLSKVASVAGKEAGAMEAWLRAEGPGLRRLVQPACEPSAANALIHVDIRSDNLRWREGRLYLLDWPHYMAGSPEFDVSFFVQSVAAEGGPLPESLLDSYRKAIEVDRRQLDASIAATLGFFLGAAWQPELAGLPRLRRWQRKQVRATLEWAVRAFGLRPVPWTAAIPDSEPGLPT